MLQLPVSYAHAGSCTSCISKMPYLCCHKAKSATSALCVFDLRDPLSLASHVLPAAIQSRAIFLLELSVQTSFWAYQCCMRRPATHPCTHTCMLLRPNDPACRVPWWPRRCNGMRRGTGRSTLTCAPLGAAAAPTYSPATWARPCAAGTSGTSHSRSMSASSSAAPASPTH